MNTTPKTITALVIPVEGPVYEVELQNNDNSSLDVLQKAVGGHIEAVPVPHFVKDSDKATAYVNEEGKFDPDCKPNMRATDFMVPGVGIHFGDYIAGSMVLAGFDWRTGGHADLPQPVIDRARLIESEAS